MRNKTDKYHQAESVIYFPCNVASFRS